MAYSNVWDVTRPLGSVLANQIDTEIQAVRKDVQERLMTLFGLSVFTADPLQGISLNLKGTTTSRIVPGSVSLSLRNNADSADNILITDAGIISFRGVTSVGVSVGGDLVIGNGKALRASNAAGTGIITINFVDGANTVHLGDATTINALGIPTSVTSAVAGETVIGNARSLRAANAAGTDTLALISLAATNRVLIGHAADANQLNQATQALGGGAAATNGTIGGTGPATAAQNAWFKFYDTAGVAFWVPVWR